jgi:hypothetical protein
MNAEFAFGCCLGVFHSRAINLKDRAPRGNGSLVPSRLRKQSRIQPPTGMSKRLRIAHRDDELSRASRTNSRKSALLTSDTAQCSTPPSFQ